MRLKDKVALISGASRGIGAAVARLFATEGARVVVTDIRENEGHHIEDLIREQGGHAMFVRLDVTKEEQWRHAVNEVEKRFGRLDVLVNNAGMYQRATLGQTDVQDWDRVMELNAKGVFLGCRAVIPLMQRAGSGSIVNMSSVSGLTGGFYSTAYNASKGTVRLLTKSIAVQYAHDGIRCNSVHPAPAETEMLADVFPDPQSRAARIAEIPLGRFGSPKEIAYCVLFLASDESSYVTGSELVVDGGLTAR